MQQELIKRTQGCLLAELQKEEAKTLFTFDDSTAFAISKLTSQQFWDQEKEFLANLSKNEETLSSEAVLLSFPYAFLPEASDQKKILNYKKILLQKIDPLFFSRLLGVPRVKLIKINSENGQ